MHIFVIFFIFDHFLFKNYLFLERETVKTGQIYHYIFQIFGKFTLKLSVGDKKGGGRATPFYLKGVPPLEIKVFFIRDSILN